MELIWAFAKLLEYLFIAPLWWLATGLASCIYPVEHDSRQDMLAFVISAVIVLGILFGLNLWLGEPEPSTPAAVTAAATPAPTDNSEAKIRELEADMAILNAVGKQSATTPAQAAPKQPASPLQ